MISNFYSFISGVNIDNSFNFFSVFHIFHKLRAQQNNPKTKTKHKPPKNPKKSPTKLNHTKNPKPNQLKSKNYYTYQKNIEMKVKNCNKVIILASQTPLLFSHP